MVLLTMKLILMVLCLLNGISNISTMKIISKDRVLKLSNPDITKREYDAIVLEVENRINYIWENLLKISDREFVWYAFRGDVNCINPRTGNEKIWFEGEYSSSVIEVDFQSGFPARFIWTEDEVWQKEVLNHIAQNKTF